MSKDDGSDLWQGRGEVIFYGEDFATLFNWPENPPEITIVTPNYFEDDEVCGYCQRKPGEKHEVWCRQ